MLKSGILAAAGAALITAAVSTAALADITILAWPGGPAETALRKVVDKYNETSDSKAELLYFSRDNFFDKMLADSAAGSKEFDLMLTATYNVGKYAPFMVPIDDLITDDVLKVFPQSAIDSQAYDGHVYGIPTDLSLHFLYYRTDLIDQLMSDDAWKAKYEEISEKYMGTKMEPKMPDAWTWDDFIASALFFTQSINPDSPVRYGTVLQMKNLLFNIMIWQGTVASYGGNWMDADGNITVDSDAYRKGLDIFKKITEAEATPGDSNSYEYAEANGAFGTGQVAFFIQWSAAYAEFIKAEDYPAIAGKFDITHEPAGSRRPEDPLPCPRPRHQQGVRQAGRGQGLPEVPRLAGRDEHVCQGRRPAARRRQHHQGGRQRPARHDADGRQYRQIRHRDERQHRRRRRSASTATWRRTSPPTGTALSTRIPRSPMSKPT